MSPAGDLREAAKLLRKRAEAATAGPWMWGDATGGRPWAVFTRPPAPGAHLDLLRSERKEDALYIASMHPLVGLALADAFEQHVEDWYLPQQSEADEADLAATDRLLALARLYLGRPE